MPKILIVEDDIDLVETYTDLLTARNYQITSVSRASDAVIVVTKFLPDIILLDLNLPGEPGTVVISMVHQYQRLANTKIIVATGHPEILKRSSYIASRVDFILCKPVQNEELLGKIDKLLTSTVM
jgi:DNA-binding response OmpR family regulator